MTPRRPKVIAKAGTSEQQAALVKQDLIGRWRLMRMSN